MSSLTGSVSVGMSDTSIAMGQRLFSSIGAMPSGPRPLIYLVAPITLEILSRVKVLNEFG